MNKKMNRMEIVAGINELGRITSELARANKEEIKRDMEYFHILNRKVTHFREENDISSSRELTEQESFSVEMLVREKLRVSDKLEELAAKTRLDLLAEEVSIDRRDLVKLQDPSKFNWEFSEEVERLLQFIHVYKGIKRRKLTPQELEMFFPSEYPPRALKLTELPKLKQFNAVSKINISKLRRGDFWQNLFLAPYVGEINEKNIECWKEAYNKASFQDSLFNNNTLTLKQVKVLMDKMSSLSPYEKDYVQNKFRVFALPFEEAQSMLKGGKKVISEMIIKHESLRLIRDVEEDITKVLGKDFSLLKDGVCSLQIPSIEKEGISLRLVDAKDPIQVSLGAITHCCQTHGGAGEASMMEGLINPDSGFLVYEAAGAIIGQSWVWTDDKGRLVVDSVEMANGGDPNKIVPILQDLADSYDQPIVIGMDHSRIKLKRSKGPSPTMCRYKWDEFYSDTEERFSVLYPNKEVKM